MPFSVNEGKLMVMAQASLNVNLNRVKLTITSSQAMASPNKGSTTSRPTLRSKTARERCAC